MILGVKNGSFSYGKREILRNISFDLEEQKIMTILGPNGVGKTTLLKCIMGFLPWNGGEARILEKNLKAYSDRELWRQISYVPQAKRSAFSYGVLEMVVMGLDKENSFFYTPKKDQFDKANEMLKELGVGKLAGRYCNELSGGEQQRCAHEREGQRIVSQVRVSCFEGGGQPLPCVVGGPESAVQFPAV